MISKMHSAIVFSFFFVSIITFSNSQQPIGLGPFENEINTDGESSGAMENENLMIENANNEESCPPCVDARFMQHYEAKVCKPVFKDNCPDCPVRYNCEIPKEENVEPEALPSRDMCMHERKEYRVGDFVPNANPCRICRCGYRFVPIFRTGLVRQMETKIHCINAECPEHFGVPPFPLAGLEADFNRIRNCYYAYEKDKCCGKRVCPALGGLQAKDETGCMYQEKKYKVGQKIYPKEDICKVCICSEDWNEGNVTSNSGCYDIQCDLQSKYQLKQGCIPIYHESHCCPIDFHCPYVPFRQENIKNRCSLPPLVGNCFGFFPRFFYTAISKQCQQFVYGGCRGNANNFATKEECEKACIATDSDNSTASIEKPKEEGCTFNGANYPVGSTLNTGQSCVNCTCMVPPDFTCIHQTCPPPPEGICRTQYIPGQCCPKYECNEALAKAQFDPAACPTPMCSPGCKLREHENYCPECECPRDGEKPEEKSEKEDKSEKMDSMNDSSEDKIIPLK